MNVPFKILHYDYMNTGGNTMVGIFTVWLPKERRTVYALTNEEGCTLSVVDYISHELDIDNYDDLYIDMCDFGRLTGYEKYFELYRYCLNEYTKSDCRHFGITRAIPYHLLSDDLRKGVSYRYIVWLKNHGHDTDVDTDGTRIIYHPDYDQDNEHLKAIKDFKAWHDGLINKDTTDQELESFYDKVYRLNFNGKRVVLPFNADTFNKINDLLDSIIEEW